MRNPFKANPNWRTAEHPGYKNKKQEARGGTRRQVAVDTVTEAVMSRLERVTHTDRAAAEEAETIKAAALERKREAAKKVAKIPASAPEAERKIGSRQLKEATRSAKRATAASRRANSRLRRSTRALRDARRKR